MPVKSIEMSPNIQELKERTNRIAEKLGISENMPVSTDELEFDANFNVVESTPPSSPKVKIKKPKVQGKTKTYADFIRDLDQNDFIDADILKKHVN